MGPIEGGGKGKGKSTMPMHGDGDEVGVLEQVLVTCGLIKSSFSGSGQDW